MTSVARRYAQHTSTFARPSGHGAAEEHAPVVLMVSGGADSTALLVLAATSTLDIADGRGLARIAKERLHVLHVNHGLRGKEADQDEAFVSQLCEQFGIPCEIVRAHVADLAAQYGGNVENAGREVRYAAAHKLANTLASQLGISRSAARILTAHTANDRAETFLANVLKGTGTAGLSSIPCRRNRIVRPLLDYTHEDLCNLLLVRGIAWREDATNSDTHYQRAFIRHKVLPQLKQRNAHVVQSIGTTCEILSDEDIYLSQLAAQALRTIQTRSQDGLLAVSAAKLAAMDVAIARRVVRRAVQVVEPECRIEAQHVNRVLGIVAQGTGSVTLPMDIDCRVEFGILFVRSHTNSQQCTPQWLAIPQTVALTKKLCVSACLVSVQPGTNPEQIARAHGKEWENNSVLLDAQLVGVIGAGAQLWLESPQPGDVMCPLGMHGQSKKLSDLLNEAKIPVSERSNLVVVRTQPAGPIVWVAGVRADERFRCTDQTKVLLELKVHTN
ncbi:MAG: tRNA lysidine(34) synthetase TilS [Atopobium sp.]|uniref:tRNA lysidine(34) synthetase TilS n=1 Tax=Atopobium sp. TaxID=1872650 RepID=UPI002A81CBD1|nr:tRNA lysidine(34) synthetase TilS [Atopobium sp.]MDY4522943.1 tRNA lysidine(34) synthetase TilS [Atopobium sp.]